MIDHRIHRTAVHAEIQSRRSQLAEIPQVITPVGLWHYSNAVAMLLQPPRNYRCTERRVIDKRITRKEDHIDVIPAQ